MTPFGLSGLLAGISSLSLGIFVLLKCPEKRVGRIWFLFSLTVSGWGFGAMGIGCAKTPHLASLSWFIGYALGVIWIAPTLYHFICIFLGQDKRKSILMHYGIGVLFLAAYPSHYFFKRMDFMWNSIYFMRSGPLHYVFFVWWAGLVIYSHYLMIRAYPIVSLTKKNQIKYFLTATIIGFGGGSMGFLPDFGIDLYPWAHFLVFPYPIIMSYAILKHQLMDINVVIRKALLYSLITAGLASVYAGVVTFLAKLFENQSATPVLFPADIFRWFAHNLKVSFAYSCVATSLFSFGFCVFVWWKSPRKPVHRMWALTCLSISVWSLGLGMVVRAPNWANAYFWERWVQYPGTIMIPIFLLHFVAFVAEIPSLPVLRVGYGIAIFLEILNFMGHLVSIKVQAPFNYFTLALPAYWTFIVFYFSLILYAQFLLVIKLLSVGGQSKNQIKYILLAMFIGFAGGSTSLFPVFNIPIFPYGVYAMPLYIVIVSYAIFKHQLMDINIVIHKTLLYSLISASLAAVYVGTITLLAHVLGDRHGSVSAFSSAMAAIFITLIFNPLRVRIQRFVDSHFSREAIDQTVLREITGVLVHEIKTPLANIALPAELTLMDMDDLGKGVQPPEDLIPKIKKRMQYIMDQALLAGSKVEAVREATVANDIAKGTYDLKKVLESSLNQMRHHLQKPPVKVEIKIPDTLQPISGSAAQLEIVFANLVKNAAEAMEALPAVHPHEIHIKADIENGYVTICVSDTGPGVTLENLEKIFQSHYTTKGSRGSGMGLFLSRQIVQAHGGSIQVHNGTDRGARFIVRLPCRENRHQFDSA
jgi:signal transduction histidine kinase